ncbi:MAG: hypothetical protein KF713_05290 [Turneriella sp.]|nr:hypothetical protein [Turneriella sp.]
MPGTGANLFLQRRHAPSWLDSIQAKVGFSLFLLVFLAIPAFLLMVQNKYLVLYYLIHPAIVSFGIYLLYRGKQYIGSLVIVLSVYAVFAWMASLVGFSQLTPLNWWIIALLPWVMFTEKQRAGLWFTTALPVVFSFALPYMPAGDSRLLPAEQDFIRQILRISVALGAFCCIYFLRSLYYQSERLRLQENEFYSNTLNAIPLPIIIKDGITLDYVFFNQAAQLTYDLNPKVKNNNTTTFSESCATTVSRLDQEVLRSVTYHIEPDENLVHQTGLHWHFRTYRIPLELKSSGRRLLVTISEDLRALNLVMRKAQENKEMIGQVFHLLSPLFFHFALGIAKVTIATPAEWLKPWQGLELEIISYLEYHLPRHPIGTDDRAAPHRFPLAGRTFDLYYGALPQSGDIFGLVIPVRDNS